MRREFFLVFLSPLVLVAIGVGYVTAARQAGTRRAEQVVGEALYREIVQTVRDRYVVDADADRLVYGAGRGIMAELDRHSRIYDAEEWADRSITSQGEYVGIGVLIGRLRGKRSVIEVFEGGPADKAGVRHGDRIVAVGSTPVDERTEVDALVAGPRGTEIELTLVPLEGGRPRTVTVIRSRTPSRIVYGYAVGQGRIGYVHVESFRDNTLELFDHEVARLRRDGVESLVLDLRGNLGGNLDAAVGLADRFIAEGLITTTAGRIPTRHRWASGKTPLGGMPLVVLVDGLSASASEVVAGALQDHACGVLLGERTFGKGVVQEVAPFQSGWPGGMKLTTAHYFTPSGRCIERSIGLGRDERRRGGLIPDVPVRMSPSLRTRADRAAWYSRLNAHRQRGRYDPRVRKILEEEEPAFDDRHMTAAIALLSKSWVGDRKLLE